MEVTVLTHTKDPEETLCKAARNDYMSGWIGETSFGEAMSGLEPNEEDWDLAQEAAGYRTPPRTNDTVAKMARLVNKLMGDGHYGPFEHPSITFSVKGVSRITMAQITRHRPITFDVQSMRYVDFTDPDFISIPEEGNAGIHGRFAEFADWVKNEKTEEVIGIDREEIYEHALRDSAEAYHELLDHGVAPENARAVFPLATKVNMTFTMNLRTLLHIIDMRAAADAQWEIREMTEALVEEAKKIAPLTVLTFERDLKGRKNRLAP